MLLEATPLAFLAGVESAIVLVGPSPRPETRRESEIQACEMAACDSRCGWSRSP